MYIYMYFLFNLLHHYVVWRIGIYVWIYYFYNFANWPDLLHRKKRYVTTTVIRRCINIWYWGSTLLTREESLILAIESSENKIIFDLWTIQSIWGLVNSFCPLNFRRMNNRASMGRLPNVYSLSGINLSLFVWKKLLDPFEGVVWWKSHPGEMLFTVFIQ